MDVRLIVAIFRRDKLEEVESRIRALGVERVNVSKVKGYGEYHNYFTTSGMVDEVRIEIYTKNHEVEAIATAIMDAAHTGLPGDGIVAVLPVEELFLIRTHAKATPDQFWPAARV